MGPTLGFDTEQRNSFLIKFGVATENSHLDSTSLSVEGEYKKEYPTVEILKSGAVGEEIETRQQPIKMGASQFC